MVLIVRGRGKTALSRWTHRREQGPKSAAVLLVTLDLSHRPADTFLPVALLILPEIAYRTLPLFNQRVPFECFPPLVRIDDPRISRGHHRLNHRVAALDASHVYR